MKVKSPNEFFYIIKNKFDKGDLLIIITVSILGLINNFNFFIGESVSPDALSIHNYYIAGNWELQLGRFLIKFTNSIRYGLVNKFIIIVISLLCIMLSIILLKRIFNIKRKLSLFILSCIISVAPQFTETYMFIYCADAYLIAFLLSIFTVYFLNRTKYKNIGFIFAIISTVIVCALYQAYLGVILGLIIALLIHESVTNDINLKDLFIKFIKYFVTIFLGVVLYYIILKIILHLSGLQLSSYKGANGLGLNLIMDLPNNLFQCYIDFYNFFFSNKIIYNGWYHRKKIYCLLFLFTVIGYCIVIFRSKRKFTKSISIVLLSILYPICVNIMNIIAQGTTINLVTGTGLIITIIFPIILLDNKDGNSLINIDKWILSLCCVLLSWTYILGNTSTYILREKSFNNYKTITQDIYNKVTSLNDYKPEMPWMFSDVIRFKPDYLEKSNGFITNDNITWNNYDGTLLNREFYDKYLGIKIINANKNVYDRIKNTDEFKSMPIYPQEGSIKIIDEVVVIKVSNNTY